MHLSSINIDDMQSAHDSTHPGTKTIQQQQQKEKVKEKSLSVHVNRSTTLYHTIQKPIPVRHHPGVESGFIELKISYGSGNPENYLSQSSTSLNCAACEHSLDSRRTFNNKIRA